jgi:hypothetical protein
VSFSPDADWSLMDHIRMAEELGELFGRRVDLVSKRAVERSQNWMRRKAILESAEIILQRNFVTLLDIIKAARLVEEFIRGYDEQKLIHFYDLKTQSAVLHQLATVQEKLPSAYQPRFAVKIQVYPGN